MKKRLISHSIAHGKHQKTEESIKRVLKTSEKAFEPRHDNTLKCPRNQADVLHCLGKYSASTSGRRGRESLRPEHSTTLRSMRELEPIPESLGEFEVVEKIVQQMFKKYRKTFRPEHSNTLFCIQRQAVLQERLGKYKTAEDMIRHAIRG